MRVQQRDRRIGAGDPHMVAAAQVEMMLAVEMGACVVGKGQV
jgi:hypothetical protein